MHGQQNIKKSILDLLESWRSSNSSSYLTICTLTHTAVNVAVSSFRGPYLLCTSRSNVTRCQGNRFWSTTIYEMSAERSTADATVLFLSLGVKFVNS